LGIASLAKNSYNNNTIQPWIHLLGGKQMAKHIKTINTASLQKSVHTGGCGECQTSCQSACKTSCTVANQACQK
jgi:predicted ribosomally synthesized six-cysteine peptide SCIFF